MEKIVILTTNQETGIINDLIDLSVSPDKGSESSTSIWEQVPRNELSSDEADIPEVKPQMAKMPKGWKSAPKRTAYDQTWPIYLLTR